MILLGTFINNNKRDKTNTEGFIAQRRLAREIANLHRDNDINIDVNNYLWGHLNFYCKNRRQSPYVDGVLTLRSWVPFLSVFCSNGHDYDVVSVTNQCNWLFDL